MCLLFYIKYIGKRKLSEPENRHLQKNLQITSHIMIDKKPQFINVKHKTLRLSQEEKKMVCDLGFGKYS